MLPGQDLVSQVDLLVDHLDARIDGGILELLADGLEVGVEPSSGCVLLRGLRDVHVKLPTAGSSAQRVKADDKGHVRQQVRVHVLETSRLVIKISLESPK